MDAWYINTETTAIISGNFLKRKEKKIHPICRPTCPLVSKNFSIICRYLYIADFGKLQSWGASIPSPNSMHWTYPQIRCGHTVIYDMSACRHLCTKLSLGFQPGRASLSKSRMICQAFNLGSPVVKYKK